MKKIVLFFLTLLISLSACDYFLGAEIARLAINESSSDTYTKEESVELDLKKGDEILVWSDMKMAYDGEVGMFFDLQIFKDGELLEQIQFDPRKKKISVQEVKTEVNGQVKWKFEGKNGSYTAKEDGIHTFKGIFYAMPSVEIKKAEIFFRK